MSVVERPSFYEGQVLAAADLEASVAHARGGLARHERYHHTSGIVTGLALTGEDRADDAGTPYQDVTLEAGIAVDPGGRQIVLPAEELLDADRFDQVNGAGADEQGWYPIFVRGGDVSQPISQPFGAEPCGSAALPTRVVETATIEYGRLGDTADGPGDQSVGVGDGPPATSGRVLVGYVRWSAAIRRFAEVATEPPGPPPASRSGVAGDEVAARAGRLELRTGLGRVAGTPAIHLEDTDGGRLSFGVINGSGEVEAVFSIDAAGNITTDGSLSEGTLISGSAHVASGVATDGVLLPLPAGVTEQDVEDGSVVVHVEVSPLRPGSAAPLNGADVVEIPTECEVDADRRVRCRTRWVDLGDLANIPAAVPSACRYLVIAAVPATGGA